MRKLTPESEKLNAVWDEGAKRGAELQKQISEEVKDLTPDERYMFLCGLTSEFSHV